MASNAVRLSKELIDRAAAAGQIYRRSASGQIEYWARIGAALESPGNVSISELSSLLAEASLEDRAENSHWKIVRFETALHLLTEQTARISRQRRAETDPQRREVLLKQLRAKSDLMETLTVDDIDAIEQIEKDQHANMATK